MAKKNPHRVSGFDSEVQQPPRQDGKPDPAETFDQKPSQANQPATGLPPRKQPANN